MSHALTKMQGVPSGNLPNTGSDSEISQNQSRPNRPTSRFGFSHQRNTQNTIPATAKATFKEIDEAFAASGKDAAEKKAGKLRPPNFWCSCGNVEPIHWLIIFWLKWHFWGFTVYTIVSDATIFLLGRQTPEQEHELVTQSLVVSPTKIPMSMSEKIPMCIQGTLAKLLMFPGQISIVWSQFLLLNSCRQATAISTLEMLAAATPFVLPRLGQWCCVPRKWCLIWRYLKGVWTSLALNSHENLALAIIFHSDLCSFRACQILDPIHIWRSSTGDV